MQDKDTAIKFLECCEQFERIINDSGFITIERLGNDEIVGTVDFSLQTGLEGISHYVIHRCMNRDINLGVFPKDYIIDLEKSLENRSYNNDYILLLSYLRSIINNENINNYRFLYSYINTSRYNWNIVKEEKILGISQNGYAGMGLKLLI